MLGFHKDLIWGRYCSTFIYNDIFYIIQDVNIANFADDNSPFIFNKSITKVLNLLDISYIHGMNSII